VEAWCKHLLHVDLKSTGISGPLQDESFAHAPQRE
jgi:hypothetical protein